MLNAFIDRCCRAINLLIALALAVMVVMVFGNVVLRYAFNSGIAISEEVSRWLFVWITFLGAIVAVRERGHLGTDFLLARLPPLGQRICLGLSYALMIWCTWLLFSGALPQLSSADGTGSSDAFRQETAASGCRNWSQWRRQDRVPRPAHGYVDAPCRNAAFYCSRTDVDFASTNNHDGPGHRLVS